MLICLGIMKPIVFYLAKVKMGVLYICMFVLLCHAELKLLCISCAYIVGSVLWLPDCEFVSNLK